jgi:IS4 transposase
LFKIRHINKNFFVTHIKENAIYESIEELDLTDNDEEHILKDEVIRFSSAKAKEARIDQIPMRRFAIYKEDDNKTIVVMSNNLEWSASTIAALYKRRWAIELFFKAMK